MDRTKFWKEVRGWTLTILAVLAFRTFILEAVTIPTGSMIPTLQIGDYVVVQKWAYGARLPFTSEAQLQWSSPKRGEIVVLLPPHGSTRDDDLIKRVVGVAGDTVEIRDGHLVLNDVPVPFERGADECRYNDKTEGGDWHGESCVDFVENLMGGLSTARIWLSLCWKRISISARANSPERSNRYIDASLPRPSGIGSGMVTTTGLRTVARITAQAE